MQFVDNAGRTLTVTFENPDMEATLTVLGADGPQIVELGAEWRAERLDSISSIWQSWPERRRRADAMDVDTAPLRSSTPFMREQPSVIVQLKEGPVRDDSSPMQDLQSGEWGPSEEFPAWN